VVNEKKGHQELLSYFCYSN